MCNRFCLSLMVIALAACAACDRLTSPSLRDGGPDSVAALWEQVDAGTVNYNGVAGSAPDNVFIVGDQGTILHWDGIALLPEASGSTANLRGVSVVDATLAYAVGEQGTILHRQDGAWIVDPPLTTAVLNAVCASSAFAVGANSARARSEDRSPSSPCSATPAAPDWNHRSRIVRLPGPVSRNRPLAAATTVVVSPSRWRRQPAWRSVRPGPDARDSEP